MKYSEIRNAMKAALGITKCTGSIGTDISLSNRWNVRVRRLGTQPMLYIVNPDGHQYGGHTEKSMGSFVSWALWFMEEL